ncbi:hypothetical protein LTR27_001228 [Elasticomyces elasticus]|nr:hypothetical protein LTR27_001228 [Elasticomyces elasticus]
MPVTTISADRVSYQSGTRVFKPEFKPILKHGDRGPSGYRCRARQLLPLMDLVVPGKRLAIDVEGVILDDEVSVEKKGAGRISVIEEDKGKIVIDTFVYYPDGVRFHLPLQDLKLGVKPQDILPENGARPLVDVLKEIQTMVDKSGFIVGHAFENERHMLRGVSFEKCQVYDTQLLPEYRQYAKAFDPSLADLSQAFFKKSIQAKCHSSVVDARYNMKLYQLRRTDIENQQNVRPISTTAGSSTTASTATSSDRAISTSSVTTGSAAASTGSVRIAPGYLVALPAIAIMARGRIFDHRTSTYN